MTCIYLINKADQGHNVLNHLVLKLSLEKDNRVVWSTSLCSYRYNYLMQLWYCSLVGSHIITLM